MYVGKISFVYSRYACTTEKFGISDKMSPLSRCTLFHALSGIARGGGELLFRRRILGVLCMSISLDCRVADG